MARPTARLGSSLTHARGATKPLPVRWRSRHIAADCMEIVSTCGAMWRHRCALLAGPTTMRGYAASPTCPTNGSRSALFGSGLTSNRCQMLRWPGLMPSTVCCAVRPGGKPHSPHCCSPVYSTQDRHTKRETCCPIWGLKLHVLEQGWRNCMLRIFCYFHFIVEVLVSAGVTLIDVLLRCAAVAFCCVVPSLSFVLFVYFNVSATTIPQRNKT